MENGHRHSYLTMGYSYLPPRLPPSQCLGCEAKSQFFARPCCDLLKPCGVPHTYLTQPNKHNEDKYQRSSKPQGFKYKRTGEGG